MYTVTIDGNYLSHPKLKDYQITDPVLNQEVNQVPNFDFTIYSNHPMYSSIKRLKSVIEVFDDGELIFRGRPINDATGMYKQLTIMCEGDLAFFNDSVIFPYTFNGTPKALLQKYINEHNNQVDLDKRFSVGNVTVVDNNDYIIRSNIQHTATWTELTDKTIGLMGGYLILRRENDTNYIDWLKDSPYRTSQTIELAKNLLDFNQEVNADEIITVLVPLGAKLKDAEGNETDERLTIESVNGKSPYIRHELGVERYGKIVGYQVFDDVTNPSNLKTKGVSSLNQLVNLGVSTTIKAVDMNMVDKNIKKIRFFEYVRVVSEVHNLDEDMLIKKQSINLTDPSQNTISVGVDIKTFTQNQLDRDKIIRIIKSDYVTNAQMKGMTDPLIKQISEIDQKYNLISLSVEEMKENIPRGNLLPNSSNQLGYEGWSFNQPGRLPGFAPPKRPMNTTSPTYMIIPNAESLSGMSMLFDTEGTANTPYAAVIPDVKHSFRLKRIGGNSNVSIEVLEYTTQSSKEHKTHRFDFGDMEAIIQGSVELLANTRYVRLGIITHDDTKSDNLLALGELMFNRGDPSIWQESAGDVFNYAKAELKIQKDMIEARVDKSNVVSTINQTAEKIRIKANLLELDGLLTVTNAATSGATVINGDNITAGKIKSRHIEFDNAVGKDVNLTGTITATAGKIGNFKINPNELTLDSIYYTKKFTDADLARVQQIIEKDLVPTQKDWDELDVNRDGTFTVSDMSIMKSAMLGYMPNPIPMVANVNMGDSYGDIRSSLLGGNNSNFAIGTFIQPGAVRSSTGIFENLFFKPGYEQQFYELELDNLTGADQNGLFNIKARKRNVVRGVK
ncbi:phage tail spike protein [Erysipelothrix anatis]|uniref:phage tail spike protein n=1 Tax=Erysipelothrix anatis TaxID=2683713 RepID=UPI00140C5B4E|nr:phage tail spike protein [Erysipelothrix anatis]